VARFTVTPGPNLEVRRERVEVTTALPQPDPRWSYTDAHGHDHAYGTQDDPYPTLARRYSETYWCEECDDEHQDTWLECLRCGEMIEPGTVVDTSPRWVPGPKEYVLDGKPISPEEGERILAEQQQAAQARKQAARVRELEPLAGAMRAEGLGEDVVCRVLARLGDQR
jgi:hypothetical protein